MQTGSLTVTGEGSTEIPLSGWPHEVFVFFKKDNNPVPCNPHHHDHLEHHVEHDDENPKEHHRPGHKHHDRKFFLVIKWKVEGLREIDWIVMY